MVGVTLSTTLTGVLVEVPYLWRRGTLATVAVALALRGGICLGLSGLSALPFVVGAHAAARTGRVRLLFGVCLVLFFVGLALRAFLFFAHVRARMQDAPGPEGALVTLVTEPLASAAAVGLLWGLRRAR